MISVRTAECVCRLVRLKLFITAIKPICNFNKTKSCPEKSEQLFVLRRFIVASYLQQIPNISQSIFQMLLQHIIETSYFCLQRFIAVIYLQQIPNISQSIFQILLQHMIEASYKYCSFETLSLLEQLYYNIAV